MNTKLSLTLSLLIGSVALFQGCSSTDDTIETTTGTTAPVQTSTTIEGSTTLMSSPLRAEEKATVCLDLDKNSICDTYEPQTHTDAIGDYVLTVDTAVSDGDIIIVEGGISMFPRDENSTNLNTLQFFKYFNSAENEQNINPMSTLIVQELQKSSYTYEEILIKLSSDYYYSKEMLLNDPLDGLDEESDYFKFVAALEIYMIRQANSSVQRASSLQRAVETTTTTDTNTTAPTSEELDAIIAEYSTIFDDFIASVEEFFTDISDTLEDWYDSFLSDETSSENNTTVELIPDSEREAVEVTRSVLNGTWYIVDASGDITCSTISSNDSMVVVEADGTETSLSLSYDDTAKSIELTVGWINVDTIIFDVYYNNATFTGHYASDGETMNGRNMTSSECRTLLGV